MLRSRRYAPLFSPCCYYRLPTILIFSAVTLRHISRDFAASFDAVDMVCYFRLMLIAFSPSSSMMRCVSLSPPRPHAADFATVTIDTINAPLIRRLRLRYVVMHDFRAEGSVRVRVSA